MTDNNSSFPESNLPSLSGAQEPARPELGRNEPCPCGSGKKYKRCHGVAAAPKLSQPKTAPDLGAAPGGMGAMPPGMENMDPAMMTQAAQMLQRLPRGQLQKLQSIMQRAMAGKDVTREAEDFQRTLPPEFQQMMTSFAQMQMGGAMGGMPGMPGMPGLDQSASAIEVPSSTGMSEEEARAIIESAAKEGRLSQEKAASLLQAEGTPEGGDAGAKKDGGMGKLWKKITG